jgi:hypothetical protein
MSNPHLRPRDATHQQQLNLEKDYFERALKVLTLRQVAQLYQAERDFTKEVLQRLVGASRPATINWPCSYPSGGTFAALY